MKQATNIGYVIKMRKASPSYPGFYSGTIGLDYAMPLRFAEVFNRRMAYMLRNRGDETVHKVELFKNGKPKRVISRK